MEEESQKNAFMHLRDDWYDLQVFPGMLYLLGHAIKISGDYIHVTGPLDLTTDSITIDNACSNLIVLHPDTLISSTHVADSFECPRKSILQGRVRAGNVSSKAMVHGKLLHELLQRGLKSGDFSKDAIRREIDDIIKESIEDLYTIGEDETAAKKALLEHVETLHAWSSVYFGRAPKASVHQS